MRAKKKIIGVESVILQVLNDKKGLGVTSMELQLLAGVSGDSFKNAIVRLRSKNLIVRWPVSTGRSLLISAEYIKNAHYPEAVKINPLYALLGGTSGSITIQRSVPFSILPDDGLRKSNRYRDVA